MEESNYIFRIILKDKNNSSWYNDGQEPQTKIKYMKIDWGKIKKGWVRYIF